MEEYELLHRCRVCSRKIQTSESHCIKPGSAFACQLFQLFGIMVRSDDELSKKICPVCKSTIKKFERLQVSAKRSISFFQEQLLTNKSLDDDHVDNRCDSDSDTHTPEKTELLLCGYCDRTFSDVKLLRSHQASHENVKPVNPAVENYDKNSKIDQKSKDSSLHGEKVSLNLGDVTGRDHPKPPILLKITPKTPGLLTSNPKPPILFKINPKPPGLLTSNPKPPILFKINPKPPSLLQTNPKPPILLKINPRPPSTNTSLTCVYCDKKFNDSEALGYHENKHRNLKPKVRLKKNVISIKNVLGVKEAIGLNIVQHAELIRDDGESAFKDGEKATKIVPSPFKAQNTEKKAIPSNKCKVSKKVTQIVIPRLEDVTKDLPPLKQNHPHKGWKFARFLCLLDSSNSDPTLVPLDAGGKSNIIVSLSKDQTSQAVSIVNAESIVLDSKINNSVSKDKNSQSVSVVNVEPSVSENTNSIPNAKTIKSISKPISVLNAEPTANAETTEVDSNSMVSEIQNNFTSILRKRLLTPKQKVPKKRRRITENKMCDKSTDIDRGMLNSKKKIFNKKSKKLSELNQDDCEKNKNLQSRKQVLKLKVNTNFGDESESDSRELVIAYLSDDDSQINENRVAEITPEVIPDSAPEVTPNNKVSIAIQTEKVHVNKCKKSKLYTYKHKNIVVKVIPPKTTEAIPPRTTEVIPPKYTEVIPPKNTEVIPPKNTEVIPPKNTEVIPPKTIKKTRPKNTPKKKTTKNVDLNPRVMLTRIRDTNLQRTVKINADTCETIAKYSKASESPISTEITPLIKCGLCDRTWLSYQMFVRHLKQAHSDDQNYPCTLCGQSFTTIKDFTSHVRDHRIGDRYDPKNTHLICKKCNVKLDTKAQLSSHIAKCFNVKMQYSK